MVAGAKVHRRSALDIFDEFWKQESRYTNNYVDYQQLCRYTNNYVDIPTTMSIYQQLWV